MRAGHHHEPWDRLPVAVLAVLVALVVLGGVMRLVQTAADLGPEVGEILTFEPGRRLTYDPAPQVVAARPGLPDCTLDIALIQRLGGSFVLESRSPLPDRVFHVRWAGRRTSDGPGDCGRSAELVLTQEKLNALALAAGGYGVSRKPFLTDTPAAESDSTPAR